VFTALFCIGVKTLGLPTIWHGLEGTSCSGQWDSNE
jgi:hypothetical protein